MKNVALNKDKFRFCQTEIPFVGFDLTLDGYTVSKEITNAMSKFSAAAVARISDNFSAKSTNLPQL